MHIFCILAAKFVADLPVVLTSGGSGSQTILFENPSNFSKVCFLLPLLPLPFFVWMDTGVTAHRPGFMV
jgi:hypothetical protein